MPASNVTVIATLDTGGSGQDPYYTISVDPSNNGVYVSAPSGANEGALILVKVTYPLSYTLTGFSVTGQNNNTVQYSVYEGPFVVDELNYIYYTFTMPASDVVITTGY